MTSSFSLSWKPVLSFLLRGLLQKNPDCICLYKTVFLQGMSLFYRIGISFFLFSIPAFSKNILFDTNTSSSQTVAQERPSIISALTQENVSVTADFSGTNLTLYGVVKGFQEDDDMIIVTRGPQHNVKVMQKKRILGVWVNTNPVLFEKTPVFYITTATRPLDLASSFSSRRLLGLGLEHIKLSTPDTLKFETRFGVPVLAAEKGGSLLNYKEALIRENKKNQLYLNDPFGVQIIEGGLFQTIIPLPASTPIGEYQIFIYLMRQGKAIASRESKFRVMKVGIERTIYDMAYTQPVLYALLAIFLALFSGWFADILWSRR